MRREKSLSNGKKLLLIMLFSISVAVFAVGIGNLFRCTESLTVLYTIATGIVNLVTITALLRDYKTTKKEKNNVWYIDDKLNNLNNQRDTFLLKKQEFWSIMGKAIIKRQGA